MTKVTRIRAKIWAIEFDYNAHGYRRNNNWRYINNMHGEQGWVSTITLEFPKLDWVLGVTIIVFL